MYAKVKEHDNLIRDMNSKAVLNTDKLPKNNKKNNLKLKVA
jgi:hypothetical protein